MQTMISLPKRAQTLWPSSRCWRSDCYLHWWDSNTGLWRGNFSGYMLKLSSPCRPTLYGSILKTMWRWRAAGTERTCPSRSTSSCRAACRTGSLSDSAWSGETVRWRREKRQRRRLVGFWILCLIVFVFAVRYASDGGWAVSVVTLTPLWDTRAAVRLQPEATVFWSLKRTLINQQMCGIWAQTEQKFRSGREFYFR